MTSTYSGHVLDKQLVKAVVQATSEVLGTMAHLPTTYKEVSKQSMEYPCGDISAVIGLHGDDGAGVIALSFSFELASLIVSRLLDVKPEALTYEERCDGVGELVNMICGSTKAALSEITESLYKLSLPTVIVGPHHEIYSHSQHHTCLLITFETEGHPFHLKVSFKAS